jgi:hypothetical protein
MIDRFEYSESAMMAEARRAYSFPKPVIKAS